MSEEEAGEEYLFKIVIIGDSVVDKSNLLSRYARNEFGLNTKATIGVEFQTLCMQINDKEVSDLDTAGQVRFRVVTSTYYRSVVDALVVYDVSRRSNFDSQGDDVKCHIVKVECKIGEALKFAKTNQIIPVKL